MSHHEKTTLTSSWCQWCFPLVIRFWMARSSFSSSVILPSLQKSIRFKVPSAELESGLHLQLWTFWKALAFVGVVLALPSALSWQQALNLIWRSKHLPTWPSHLRRVCLICQIWWHENVSFLSYNLIIDLHRWFNSFATWDLTKLKLSRGSNCFGRGHMTQHCVWHIIMMLNNHIFIST